MKKILVSLGAGLFLLFVALVVYGQAVGLDLSHDEHQFIAPAVLWAREGLLPYRDVPLFHQPYLVALDALVVKNAASPLLATRLVSGTAAFLTGLLIFGTAWQMARRHPPGIRLAAAASITLLWLTSHLFIVSSGRTWNHDLPTLLAISSLAILLFVETPTRWHWFAAGLLAGLATGGRLTMAPFAGFLPLSALLWQRMPIRALLANLIVAGIGVALALAPSGWFYLQDSAGYLFGNFEFPRLPLLEADNSRILKTLTPWRKMRFFFKEVVVSNLPLFLAALGLGAAALRERKIPWRWVLPTLALIGGAFAPSRYEMQHFYVVAPLLALLAARCLAVVTKPILVAAIVVATVGCGLGGGLFYNAVLLFDREDWDITEIHRQAENLHARVPAGRVLTLAPIVALEGGLSIYPQLATGPFGWNFAYLISQTRRKQLGLLAEPDLAEFLAKDPPAAIITGVEKEKLERPFIRYARKQGYQPEILEREITLWRKPSGASPTNP